MNTATVSNEAAPAKYSSHSLVELAIVIPGVVLNSHLFLRFKKKCLNYPSPTVTLVKFLSGVLIVMALDEPWR